MCVYVCVRVCVCVCVFVCVCVCVYMCVCAYTYVSAQVYVCGLVCDLLDQVLALVMRLPVLIRDLIQLDLHRLGLRHLTI
jgi:hypothetical protein